MKAGQCIKVRRLVTPLFEKEGLGGDFLKYPPFFR